MRYLFLALLPFFLVACSDPPTSPAQPYDKSKIEFEIDPDLEDFIVVHAKDHYTVLGTNKEGVVRKEFPEMRVKFDYNFSMATHEITQKEYTDVLGGELCSGCEDLPITNVTFGDIVLYANTKSKQDGLDTVYSYTDIKFDSEKHVIELENLAFQPDCRGYRLPTEAEWVFVAASDWIPEKSWNNENANDIHKVCSKKRKTSMFCDMAGNVAEWVNDWVTYFKDTTITNFIGAPNGGNLGERIIKGGSFRNSPSNMNVYSRGDVYTVTPASRSNYLGARLVVGVINDPVWMDGIGITTSTILKNQTNLSTIKKIFGTNRAKIVFTDAINDNLVYMNYNDGLFSFHGFADTLKAFHPDISPDGNWVVFSTGIEGTSAKSSVYVRKLDPLGSRLKKLDVESAVVPRFRITPEGDTVVVYVTSAASNKDSAMFAKTSTWQVPFYHGEFGTPEKLFDGAYHGGISPNNKLAITGSQILRARFADNSEETVMDKSAHDTIWYNGEQACNASLSQDGSNRTLFLDFGGSTGAKFVGKKYDVHERILIADSTGKLVQSVGAPSNYSFNFTEWIRERNIAIATLTDKKNGTNPKIVLVNFNDSSITNLVEGIDLQYPCFWAQTINLSSDEANLDLDSLGAYMTANSHVTTRIMKIKMDLFWQYRDIMRLAVIGSSRSFSGIDPHEITSMSAMNLAYAAEDMTATEYFVKNYILNLAPNLKAIAITLDYDRWNDTNDNWESWFGDLPGYKYDENHNFWKDNVPERMYTLIQNALSPNEDEYDLYNYHDGLFYSTDIGYSHPDAMVDGDVHWLDSKKKSYQYNLGKLKNILDAAKAKGILVIGMIFPQSPLYKKKGVWGRYGLTFADAKKVYQDVENIAKDYDNFIIMDEHKNGNHDYVEDDFANDDHLGLQGATKISKRLDSLLIANHDKWDENIQ